MKNNSNDPKDNHSIIYTKLGDTRDFGNFYEMIHTRKNKILSFLNMDLLKINNPDLRPFVSLNHAYDVLMSYHVFYPCLYEDMMFYKTSDVYKNGVLDIDVVDRLMCSLNSLRECNIDNEIKTKINTLSNEVRTNMNNNVNTYIVNNDINTTSNNKQDSNKTYNIPIGSNNSYDSIACELLIYHDQKKMKGEVEDDAQVRKKGRMNRRNMVLRLKTSCDMIDCSKGVRVSDYKFLFKCGEKSKGRIETSGDDNIKNGQINTNSEYVKNVDEDKGNIKIEEINNIIDNVKNDEETNTESENEDK